MTRNELTTLVENGCDIMFDVGGKHYTILTWPEDGIVIGEQRSDYDVAFPDVDSLLNGYLVNGIPLGELAEEVVITDYS